MPLIITVSNIKINTWKVNTDNRNVLVKFDLIRDDGKPYTQNQVAYFWETIPTVDDDGNPITQPGNWYQLPAKYSQVLTDLTVDAKAALMHLINE